MKLSDWARKNGLGYKTAYRLYRSGRFPLPTEQLPTGTILVHEIPSKTNQAVLYARVSSSDQMVEDRRRIGQKRLWGQLENANSTGIQN